MRISDTDSVQNRANSKQQFALHNADDAAPEQKQRKSAHKNNESVQPENVPFMYADWPDDLVEVVIAWDKLPESAKEKIQVIVRAESADRKL